LKQIRILRGTKIKMECRNIYDIVKLIERRDGISQEEAYQIVSDVRAELKEIIGYESPFYAYELAADLLRSELGLEPDYLDILVEGL